MFSSYHSRDRSRRRHKKVLQDKRFKNRELHIMKQLRSEPHPNVIQLQHQFYSSGERSGDEVYLNLVLEYMPDTVASRGPGRRRRRPTYRRRMRGESGSSAAR